MSNDITALELIVKIKKQAESFDTVVLQEGEAKALVEAPEKAQRQVVNFQQSCENDPRIHEIIDLKELIAELDKRLIEYAGIATREAHRVAELEKYRTAFMEWHDKTAWVQTDKRFDAIKPWGKHRADVLKEYIEHLERANAELGNYAGQLESRTVTVKLYDDFQLCHYGTTEDYAKGYIDSQNNFTKWLSAAGIKVIEGKGEGQWANKSQK
ncbi:TPA: hypothetical protein ACU1SZ_001410 [Salmonella enterica]